MSYPYPNASPQGGPPPNYPSLPQQQAPAPLGPTSQPILCPSCHSQISTKIKHEPSMLTHLIAFLLCGLCCCCVPYCIDSCQNANHYCAKCDAFIGSYRHI